MLKSRCLSVAFSLLAIGSILFAFPVAVSAATLATPPKVTPTPAATPLGDSYSYAPTPQENNLSNPAGCHSYNNGHHRWDNCVTQYSYGEFLTYGTDVGQNCGSVYYCIQVKSHVDIFNGGDTPAPTPHTQVVAQVSCDNINWSDISGTSSSGGSSASGNIVQYYIDGSCSHSYRVRATLEFTDVNNVTYPFYICGSDSGTNPAYWC